MGLLGQILGDVGKKAEDEFGNAVSTVSNTINRELSNFGNTINQTLDDASRGDVGKFIVEQAKSTVNIAKAPFEIAYYGIRGDNQGVSNAVQRAVGASINRRGSESGNIFNSETVGTRLAQTDVGQYILRNPNVSNATFGISEDYAGFTRGARTLQDNAYLSREDQNSAIRFGVKGVAAAGIGTAAKAVNSWWTDLNTLDKVKYTTYGTTAGGIVDKLAKGDLKGAVKDLTTTVGLPDISEYIPGTSPEVPNNLNNPRSPAASGGTKVTDPWDTSGLDYGVVNATQSSLVPLVLGVSVLAFMYFRSKK